MRKFFGWIVMAAMVLTSCSKTEPKQENQAVPAKTEASSEVNPPDVKPSDDQGDEKVAVADKKESEPAPQGETIDHSEALALLNSVEYSEEGLKSMFKTEGHLSDLEYEALVLAIDRCTPNPENPDEYYIGLCLAYKVYLDIIYLNQLDKDYPDKMNDILTKVLKGAGSHNPVLRSFIYSEYETSTSPKGESTVDVDRDRMKSLVEFAKAEKDVRALRHATEVLAMNNGLYKSPEAVDFVLDTLAKHPNSLIRRKVAEGMIPVRYQDVDGDKVKNTLLALCNDKEKSVRGASCGKMFDFEIDNAEQLAQEYLKDPTRADAHGALFAHFLEKAFDRDNPDESAYRVVMDYLKSTPRAEDFPNHGALLALDDLPFPSKENAYFVQWTKKAPFYVEKDMVAALNDLVLDDVLDYATRISAGSSLMFFGSKKDIEAVIQKLKADNDPKNQDVIRVLERELK